MICRQSGNTARQLREYEAQMTQHRDRLSSGTADIQRLLQTGDMAGVAAKSTELESSTKAVRELEFNAMQLTQNMGGGQSVDFAALEQVLRGLTVGGGVSAPVNQAYTPSSTVPSMGAPMPRYPGSNSPPPSSSPMPRVVPAASPRTPFTPESTGRGTAVPNAIYINGVPEDTSEADLREVFARFGEIKMINSRHIATGGFAFIFFSTDTGAAAALEKPKVMIKGKAVNILAKKQLVPKERPGA